MVKSNHSHEERKLAACLRVEAQADRPDFSEERHARWLAALRQHQADRAARSVRPRFLGVARFWRVTALAASLLLGGTFLFWSLMSRPETPSAGRQPLAVSPKPAPSPPMAVTTAEDARMDLLEWALLADRTTEELGLTFGARLAEGQWAYLDHDARLVASALLDQLPIDPTSWDTVPEKEM